MSSDVDSNLAYIVFLSRTYYDELSLLRSL